MNCNSPDMSGKLNDLQAKIAQQEPTALYVYCSNSEINAAITKKFADEAKEFKKNALEERRPENYPKKKRKKRKYYLENKRN